MGEMMTAAEGSAMFASGEDALFVFGKVATVDDLEEGRRLETEWFDTRRKLGLLGSGSWKWEVHSAFAFAYVMGRIAGIREERKRRKAKGAV